ncbi:hypothetical protein FZ103_10620 [Streptomonospora sp. PA3]|uniref:DNA methyltransferase n=1 Tax=Streptomonospora sp. PA3 TaxID=2607326 RepID=UPI0012DBEACE|nr:DNA methyltransferase [Streptomonospora sp. PA3]MUL41624.1 hypothetical protein [Streptomonospora sp. PA3]
MPHAPDSHGSAHEQEPPPLAVWPCAQTPPEQQRRERGLTPPVAPAAPALLPVLAQRLVAELSAPGELVADVMCGSGALTLAAARAHRRVLALDLEPECLAQTHAHLALTEAPTARRVLELIQGDARLATGLLAGHRIDLAVLDPPAPGAPHVPGDFAESNLAALSGAAYTRALTDAVAAVAVRLRPGARLVLIAAPGPEPARLAAGLPGWVQAGVDAGLDYRQHIIALTRPLRGTAITTDPAPGAAADGHHPAHLHLLVFTKPAPSPEEHKKGERR